MTQTESASIQTDAGRGCTLEQYAKACGLPQEMLMDMGVKQVKRRGNAAVQVNHYRSDGREVGKSVCIDAPSAAAPGRWEQPTTAVPLGAHTAGDPRRPVYVVSDIVGAEVLHAHGVAALAIPDLVSGNAADALLEKVEEIIVVTPDVGGAGMSLNELARRPCASRVRLLELPVGASVIELHKANPEHFKQVLDALTATAVSVEERRTRAREAERHMALSRCRGLAESQDILGDVRHAVVRLGYAGDPRPVLLVYLALCSSVLDRPVSIALKALSSAGKSFVVKTAMRFVPPSAFYVLTAMSERALVYSTEPLEHRAFVVYEADGLGEYASLMMRSLLSEGHIRYETVMTIDGELTGVLIERAGPTNLITTSTRAMHAENETRVLTDTVPDTPEQTRAVLQSEAREAAGLDAAEVDFERFHALHEYLAAGTRSVSVPFAMVLSDLIPPVAVRLRRDFKALLSLIMTHALLHQAHRERDPGGSIVATLDDYTAVYGLVAHLFAEGIEQAVSNEIRETVIAVGELHDRKREPVTIGET